MNKKIKHIVFFLCISFIYSSCETVDFGDINNKLPRTYRWWNSNVT